MKVEAVELSMDDIQSIKDAVRERRPVNFYCYTLTLEQKQRFQNILNVFLKECDESYLFNCLSYCLFGIICFWVKGHTIMFFFSLSGQFSSCLNSASSEENLCLEL